MTRITKGVAAGINSGDVKIPDKETAQLISQTNSILNDFRIKSIKVLQDSVAKLNETNIKSPDGESIQYGDIAMANDIAEKLHLGAADSNGPGLLGPGAIAIVGGSTYIVQETMNACLKENGIDPPDYQNMLSRIQTRPVEKSGPVMPSGISENEVTRSDTDILVTKDKKNLYILNDDYIEVSVGETPPDGAQGPLGRITGQKALAFIVDKDGKEIPVGHISYRTKGGENLQTTYTFGADLRKCLEAKSKANSKANEQIEMPDYLLRMLERL